MGPTMASHFESLMDQAVIHLNLSPEAEAAMRENWKVEEEEMMAFLSLDDSDL
jgi:hypothetical protein